jgi:hypothetical protein
MKLVLGMSIWLAALVAAAVGWPRAELLRNRVAEVATYLVSPSRAITFSLPAGVRLDPGQGLVLVVGEDVQRVGEVVSADAQRAVALVDPRHRELLTDGTRFTVFSGAGSIWWSLETLLPESVRSRIRAECDAFLVQNADQIRRELEPIVVGTIDEVISLLKEDLERILVVHHEEIAHLGQRFRKEIFEGEVLPLLREEIWPIMRRRGAGPAEVIGRELWGRLPLWGLTWRAAYDSVAHDAPQTVERRWVEFVRRDAIPVIMSHMDLLLDLVLDVFNDIATSPKVDATARRILLKLKDDPEFVALLKTLFHDLIRDNPRLEIYLRTKWEEPAVRRALASSGAKLESLLKTIGDLVLLNDAHTGVSPHLARVLRSVVLRKDRAYVIVQPGPGAPLPEDAVIPLANGG